MTRYYAGIGSRETPPKVLYLMGHIAKELHKKDYTLRSGAADGADTAFEFGTSGKCEIFVPWLGYGHRPWGINCGYNEWMRNIAARHHPKWANLAEFAKKLHTRNTGIVLGRDPSAFRSEFVICWTPNGAGGGGTGQAIRVARAYGVPVYDLALEEARQKVKEILGHPPAHAWQNQNPQIKVQSWPKL